LALAVIGRVGVGHLLAALWPKTGQQAAFGAVLLNLRNRLPRDASMSVLYCPESSRHEIATLQKTPTHLESMRAVKRTLDPKNVLNRGRFVL
jgi:FAD/FMN-containing dehydrogenase